MSGRRLDRVVYASVDALPQALVPPEAIQPASDLAGMYRPLRGDDSDHVLRQAFQRRFGQRRVGAFRNREGRFHVGLPTGLPVRRFGAPLNDRLGALWKGLGCRTRIGGLAFAGPSAFDRFEQLLHFRIAPIEPVGAPDPVDPPALLLEHGLAQAVALARPTGGVVPGSVALDREQEPALVVRVVDREIDPEAGGADLRGHAVAMRLQGFRNRFLEWTVHLRPGQRRNIELPGLGVLKVALEDAGTHVLGRVEADVAVADRGKHAALLLGPREEHIEPPFSPFARDGAETLRHVAALVLAIADRDEDHVPFVALDVLQVLDEEGLVLAFLAECVEFRKLGAHVFQPVPDGVALGHGQGHDAERLVGMLAGVGEHLLGYGGRFLGVVPLAAAIVRAIHLDERQARAMAGLVRARRADEAVVVELVIRDLDQRRMLGAVVPPQHAARHRPRLAKGQDAFHVADLRRLDVRYVLVILALFVARHLAVEERGRRQLLLVADHDDLLGPHDGAQAVSRPHLAGLVDQRQIERESSRPQVLRYGERAHQEHGLDRRHGFAGLVEELADGHVPGLLVRFAAHDADLAGRPGRQRLEVPQRDFLGRERLKPLVELLEFLHLGGPFRAIDGFQFGRLAPHALPDRERPGESERVRRGLRFQAAVRQPGANFVQAEFRCAARRRVQPVPVVHGGRVGFPGLQASPEVGKRHGLGRLRSKRRVSVQIQRVRDRVPGAGPLAERMP